MLGKNALISNQSRAWLTAARTGTSPTGKNRLSLLDISSRISSIARQGVPLTPAPAAETDKTIIEGLQDIVQQLEQQLKTLVLAELSVLVDLLYRPECLFPPGTEARSKCSSGGFIFKLISHTEKLLEEKEDRLCGKVLETLKEMLLVDPEYDGKVRETLRCIFRSHSRSLTAILLTASRSSPLTILSASLQMPLSLSRYSISLSSLLY